MRLRTHDVRDAEPLLIAVAGLDHAQHEHGGVDAQRSPARKIERSIAFWRIVDDNHEFRRMSRLVAAALLAHRLPRPPPDRILLRRFCGVPALRAYKRWRAGKPYAALAISPQLSDGCGLSVLQPHSYHPNRRQSFAFWQSCKLHVGYDCWIIEPLTSWASRSAASWRISVNDSASLNGPMAVAVSYAPQQHVVRRAPAE